jgi:trans-2-enoyl-CoA reductase
MKRNVGPPSVLVIGASYGLLPAAKIAAAGMPVTVVGFADEVAAINRDGVEVCFDAERRLIPSMGADGLTA